MVSDEEIREILVEARNLRSAVNSWSTPPTGAGAATTSRPSPSASPTPDAKEGEESATLISRTAEQAGLTGERMRAAGDRLRGQGPMPAPPRRRAVPRAGRPRSWP